MTGLEEGAGRNGAPSTIRWSASRLPAFRPRTV